jgi:hypothetical protein
MTFSANLLLSSLLLSGPNIFLNARFSLTHSFRLIDQNCACVSYFPRDCFKPRSS